MPSPRSTEPVYVRGAYRLIKRPDRTNYDILWYDRAAGRDRSRSAGSGDLREAKDALDRFYLQREKGEAVCPTCGRPWEEKRGFLVTQAMVNYDLLKRSAPSYDAINARLAHVHAYIEETGQTALACADVDVEWIDAFWEWAIEIPVLRPSGEERERAPGTVNNSVIQLAAAINLAHRRRDALYPAAFRAKKPQDVNRTPTYRSDIKELAAMFAYALRYREKRKNLLHFLRASVATLIRPEHAHLLNSDPEKGQWSPDAGVFNLLPKGEEQTKKRRPIVPVPRQAVPWLNAVSGPLIDAVSIASTWTHMQTALKLPGEGQAGPKLVRRSMAHLVRQRIDRRDVPELSMFLGHRESSATTDLYAPFDPEYLSRARSGIEAVIDEIEALVPGAFHRSDTAERRKVISIGRGKTT